MPDSRDAKRTSRKPTPAVKPPGTEQAVNEMVRRARLGLDLFTTGDVHTTERTGIRAKQLPNASQIRIGLVGRTPLAGFGGRLRKIRLARGLGLRQLAGRAGLNPGTLSRIEHGKIRPGLESLLAIADAVNLSVDALLGRLATVEA